MTPAQFLIDTSALARLMRPVAESFGWDQAVAAGLIAVCPITELEFFCSARSARDREETFASLRAAFCWVPVHDGAYARAWEVQGELTSTEPAPRARGRWISSSPRPRSCTA